MKDTDMKVYIMPWEGHGWGEGYMVVVANNLNEAHELVHRTTDLYNSGNSHYPYISGSEDYEIPMDISEAYILWFGPGD